MVAREAQWPLFESQRRGIACPVRVGSQPATARRHCHGLPEPCGAFRPGELRRGLLRKRAASRRFAIRSGPCFSAGRRTARQNDATPLAQKTVWSKPSRSRKTHRRPPTRRGAGGPTRLSVQTLSRGYVFPACGTRFSEPMALRRRTKGAALLLPPWRGARDRQSAASGPVPRCSSQHLGRNRTFLTDNEAP